MARTSHRPFPVLLYEAQLALHMTQAEIGRLMGWSKRTAQRWAAGRAEPHQPSVCKLAAHVHPRNPVLASEIAAAAGQTLESLGIVRPPPPPGPPAPPPPPPMPRHLAADAVVCVAAEGMNVEPGAVRGALLAAFKRARELGLSCEEVERALAGAMGEAAGKKAKAAGA